MRVDITNHVGVFFVHGDGVAEAAPKVCKCAFLDARWEVRNSLNPIVSARPVGSVGRSKAMVVPTKTLISRMGVDSLIQHLQDHGLDCNGDNAVLRARLVEFYYMPSDLRAKLVEPKVLPKRKMTSRTTTVS